MLQVKDLQPRWPLIILYHGTAWRLHKVILAVANPPESEEGRTELGYFRSRSLRVISMLWYSTIEIDTYLGTWPDYCASLHLNSGLTTVVGQD